MIIDYSTIRPAMATLKAAGVTAAGRYLGQDCEPGYGCIRKNLTKPEAGELLAAGIDIWLTFEYAADQALKGAAQGTADARLAARQLRDLGAPAGITVYFALDFDLRDYAPASSNPEAKLGPVADYFAAIKATHPVWEVGVYGGYYAVSRILDAKLAAMAWQTIAWSGGKWDSRAVLRQHVRQVLGGADVDTHTARTAEFGQWHASQPAPPAGTDWMGTIMQRLPELKAGSTGMAVKRAQALVNLMRKSPYIQVDGIFGPKTTAAVEVLQNARGLTVDGTVGKHTWAVLITGSDL